LVKRGKKQARAARGGESQVRERILAAAFAAFMEGGYAATSTLEIATRARVSKRELYAVVGNKREMLVACIGDRARRLAVPTDLPAARDRESLAEVLAGLGARLVHEVSDPAVIGVFRLAIAEAVRAPEVARVLDGVGREAGRGAVRGVMTAALSAGLLTGQPEELARQFLGLLWQDLMVSLLLGVVERPDPREISRRARESAVAFLALHPRPS